MSEALGNVKIPKDTWKYLGGAAGALILRAAFFGGEPVPDEVVEVNLPQVDAYLATELATPSMQQLRQDMLRCGADFEISVRTDDGSYTLDYDTTVGANTRPCMIELESSRIAEGAGADLISTITEINGPAPE